MWKQKTIQSFINWFSKKCIYIFSKKCVSKTVELIDLSIWKIKFARTWAEIRSSPTHSKLANKIALLGKNTFYDSASGNGQNEPITSDFAKPCTKPWLSVKWSLYYIIINPVLVTRSNRPYVLVCPCRLLLLRLWAECSGLLAQHGWYAAIMQGWRSTNRPNKL